MDIALDKITEIIDALPSLDKDSDEGCGVIDGPPIKIALVAAVLEVLMSIGTIKRFGYTLLLEIIVAFIAFYLNRNCKQKAVWATAVMAVVAAYIPKWTSK